MDGVSLRQAGAGPEDRVRFCPWDYSLMLTTAAILVTSLALPEAGSRVGRDLAGTIAWRQARLGRSCAKEPTVLSPSTAIGGRLLMRATALEAKASAREAALDGVGGCNRGVAGLG